VTTAPRSGRASREDDRVHYLRIWAGPDGESHLEDVALDEDHSPAEPGVAPLLVSEPVAVDRVHFVTVLAGSQAPDWHTGPRRQFVTFLTGPVTIETSDGARRELPAGSTVLVEDLHGRGHITTHAPGDQRVLVIPLDAEPKRR
jgi:quercetin dioxygenase-like cupin family protein